jgi:hypothetical protein
MFCYKIKYLFVMETRIDRRTQPNTKTNKKPGLKNGAFNLEGKKVELSNFMGQLLSWTLPSYMNQNIGKNE